MDTSRTQLLIGKKGIELLHSARVAVFGLGGVGSYAVEALARAGVGTLFLVDHDSVEPSNCNRQLFALEDTIGRVKTEVARERIARINPEAVVETRQLFVGRETIESLFTAEFTYAIDAIDTIQSKVLLLSRLVGKGIRHVSCMGAANRLSSSDVRIADISKTRHCPLARIVRKKLREEAITSGVRCVYSEAEIIPNERSPEHRRLPSGKSPQGTISHVCGIIGLTAAGVIINDILQDVR